MTPWERLDGFLENNQIQLIRQEARALISWLTELEELMIATGLWKLIGDEHTRPLDFAAAKRLEGGAGIHSWSGWRNPGTWSVPKLHAFATRSLINAEHLYNEDPRGRRTAERRRVASL